MAHFRREAALVASEGGHDERHRRVQVAGAGSHTVRIIARVDFAPCLCYSDCGRRKLAVTEGLKKDVLSDGTFGTPGTHK